VTAIDYAKAYQKDASHDEALCAIESLWGSPEGTPKGDRLEVLLSLVEAYDPIDAPDPVGAIRFRLEQQGLDSRALIGVIGSRSRVHEVMRGDRALSLAMIRRLHERFGIPAEALIRLVVKKKRKRAA
jgi:HTH-type transcriptional regulator/antitoxin HigA